MAEQYAYAVIGAGRQGVAAAYDLARFGDARSIFLVDRDGDAAANGAARVNELIGSDVARPAVADATDVNALAALVEGIDALVSAAHYAFNPALTDLAIRLGAHMSDLGGHTRTVLEQRERHMRAQQAGVTIVPDCGMGPGLNLSLAVYAMSLVENPREVRIWDGGLPQDPQPPWNYVSTFNLEGLINEYDGCASFLRDGRVVEVPAFDGHELIDFGPPIGRLEAFVTSGGLSTAPWTFAGRLQRLENKTLRYPGHRDRFLAFAQLGLHGTTLVSTERGDAVPRDVYKALLAPHLAPPASGGSVRDVAVVRVRAIGTKGGREVEAVIELIDRYDDATGFTAMQRLTGWHASIVAILAARRQLPPGVLSVESIPGSLIVGEARRRGFDISERVS